MRRGLCAAQHEEHMEQLAQPSEIKNNSLDNSSAETQIQPEPALINLTHVQQINSKLDIHLDRRAGCRYDIHEPQ